jgi:hypothetical protein
MFFCIVSALAHGVLPTEKLVQHRPQCRQSTSRGGSGSSGSLGGTGDSSISGSGGAMVVLVVAVE